MHVVQPSWTWRATFQPVIDHCRCRCAVLQARDGRYTIDLFRLKESDLLRTLVDVLTSGIDSLIEKYDISSSEKAFLPQLLIP